MYKKPTSTGGFLFGGIFIIKVDKWNIYLGVRPFKKFLINLWIHNLKN